MKMRAPSASLCGNAAPSRVAFVCVAKHPKATPTFALADDSSRYILEVCSMESVLRTLVASVGGEHDNPIRTIDAGAKG